MTIKCIKKEILLRKMIYLFNPNLALMLRFFYIFITLLFYLPTSPVQAQNKLTDQSVYGLDQILYNGKVYNYFPGPGVKGHQYLIDKEFISGSVTIRGKKYENLQLNYDILNQDLILKYTDLQGANRLLIVSMAWLKQFSLGSDVFSIIQLPDGKDFIVQELNQGKMKLYRHWTKRLIAKISSVSENYIFEEKKSSLFLSYNNKLQVFKSTNELLSFLDKEDEILLKNYLKQHKIKIKTASDKDLNELLNYCNTLKL